MEIAVNTQFQVLQGVQENASIRASPPSVEDVMVERRKDGRVHKKALTYAKDNVCRMTEACVESLGFDLLEKPVGTRRTHILLSLGVDQACFCIRVNFEIVPSAEYELSLNVSESVRLLKRSSGESWLVESRPGKCPKICSSVVQMAANLYSVVKDTQGER